MEVIKEFLHLEQAIKYCDWFERNYTDDGVIIEKNVFTGKYEVLRTG